MDRETFGELLIDRMTAIRKTLQRKRDEYAPDADVLANFKRSAQLRGVYPTDTLLGMLVKHWVSLEDLTKLHLRQGQSSDPAVVDEKIGDAICYLILLEAVLKEPS